ncbi:unnamed protein product [Symbiodinium sp. KB8]|nr:unnamed protein product [Symbiodinium sp. KB8]
MTCDLLVLQALLVKLQSESNEVQRKGVISLERSTRAQVPGSDQFVAQPVDNEHDQECLSLLGTPSELRLSQGPPRPFWVFDFDALETKEAWNCGLVMATAGILCAAGGIGGGGIYVTVLMVAGGLPVRDAVPLSKAVVFIGSISSLFLNLRKATASSDPLIDYNVCRLVVPAALVGTYIGVLLNSLVPTWAVLLALVGILVAISYMILLTTWQQYAEEEHFSSSVERNAKASSISHAKTENVPEVSIKYAREVQRMPPECGKCCAVPKFGLSQPTDYGNDHVWLQPSGLPSSHSFLVAIGYTEFLDAESRDRHLHQGSLTSFRMHCLPREQQIFFFLGPMLLCAAVLSCVAGSLVLLMLLQLLDIRQRALAQARSVVQAAGDSDRVIMSLTLLYGTINLDQLSTRPSAISGIVSLGVVISTLLAMRQLAIEARSPTAQPLNRVRFWCASSLPLRCCESPI